VAITLCDESLEEDGCREEEGASSRQWRRRRIRRDLGCTRRRGCGYPLIDPEWQSIQFGKNLFASEPSWSGAGAFTVHLWAEGTFAGRVQIIGR